MSDLESLRGDLARLERLMIEHDAKVRHFWMGVKENTRAIQESTHQQERLVDSINGHLEKISKNTDKAVNGGGAQKLAWFLAAAVVVAALGNKALDLLLAWFGRGGP